MSHNEKQGEAVTYENESMNFYTVSEGSGEPVYYAECSNRSKTLNSVREVSTQSLSSSGMLESSSACSDIRPPHSRHSCADQAAWGKCGEKWMVAAGNCLASCNSCPNSRNTGEADCDDIRPTASHSCAQQAEWGKCGRTWIIEGGYCRRSCGRCR